MILVSVLPPSEARAGARMGPDEQAFHFAAGQALGQRAEHYEIVTLHQWLSSCWWPGRSPPYH